MNTSIAISSKDTLGNNQVKLITNCNPNADNGNLSTFGKMANNLTTNVLNSVARIDKQDITDAQEGDTPTPTPSGGGLLNPNLRRESGTYEDFITWEGDGVCKYYDFSDNTINMYSISKGTELSGRYYACVFLLESDGTYAKDWLR